MERERIPRLDFTDFLDSEYQRFYKECNFTDRQLDIIKLKRKGLFNYQIADELGISDSTLKIDLNKIKRKILKVI